MNHHSIDIKDTTSQRIRTENIKLKKKIPGVQTLTSCGGRDILRILKWFQRVRIQVTRVIHPSIKQRARRADIIVSETDNIIRTMRCEIILPDRGVRMRTIMSCDSGTATHVRSGKPAALARASRCVISCSSVWPPVSKSLKC